MKEYNKKTELSEYPEWSEFTESNQNLDYFKYNDGFWTYYNGYVFFIESNRANIVLYRKAYLHENTLMEWELTDLSIFESIDSLNSFIMELNL